MRFSIRHRMLVWLVAVLLPIVIAASAATQLVSDQIGERIDSDLNNIRRLEAARIDEALAAYERQAESLATSPVVRALVAETDPIPIGPFRERSLSIGRGGLTGVGGPTGQAANEVRRRGRWDDPDVAEVRIIGTNGEVLAQSSGFSWEPYDPLIVADVLSDGASRVGNAFRTETGSDRVGLAVAIDTASGDRVGVLLVEMRLGPIADFVVQHEGFGETSEAHIAQRTPDGDAQLITLLRFDRDAAFDLVVPREKELPVNKSLTAGAGMVIEAKDYRGIESVVSIQTIERTGWGLVVKIDRSEAFTPIADVRRIIGLAAACAVAAVLLGWAILVRPISRRLRMASDAAASVVAGGQEPIADQSSDEIGDLSRVIDDLSRELAADEVERAETEARLEHRATHDELTGQFNRVHATSLLQGMVESDAPAPRTSLLFLDLDDFKSVNDSYGHLVGDEILVAVSARVAAELPESAVLARWGGDEFVVILPNTDETVAEGIIGQVRLLFTRPFATSVGPQQMNVSLGAATTDGGDSLDELLAEADRRMFDDKARRSTGRTALSKLHREINAALASDRIAVHYQPVVSAPYNGQPVTVGIEALVRVRDGDRESPPLDFLEASKTSRLGALLDRRVHEQAVAAFAAWRRDGIIDSTVFLSLNLTQASSSDHNLTEQLGHLAADNGLSPGDLVLEVSERSSELDPTTVASLRAAGFPLALDDFGTRYANVDRLVDLHPDIVKIDQRWLGDRKEAPSRLERRRLERLVRLARDVGARVVLEGVESEQQGAFVDGIDADYLQGFLFCAPLDEREVERWLRRVIGQHASP